MIVFMNWSKTSPKVLQPERFSASKVSVLITEAMNLELVHLQRKLVMEKRTRYLREMYEFEMLYEIFVFN